MKKSVRFNNLLQQLMAEATRRGIVLKVKIVFPKIPVKRSPPPQSLPRRGK